MLVGNIESSNVVSSEIYGFILSSDRLQRAILPDGLISSPYEILDYRVSLTLHDSAGAHATFERTQRIRFLQDGVSAILDHAWGDGVLLTHYNNTAGTLEDSFKDQGKRHLVIALKRAMGKGETLDFDVTRTSMVGFTQPEEWQETTIDHPINHLSCRTVFPKERPCREATLHCDGFQVPLPVLQQPDGRTFVRCEVLRPKSHLPYTVRWSW